MNHFVVEVEELKNQKKMRVIVNNQAILLIEDEGQIYAIQDACPHMGTSLLTGTYQDKVITCRSHKAQINVQTGEILEKAKILFLHLPTKRAKTYPVKIENQKVYIEI